MAHYLTFDSTVTCKVNGTAVSSGYELHDGDVIVATSESTGNSWFIINGGSSMYPPDDTVDISDSDIAVSAFNPTAVEN